MTAPRLPSPAVGDRADGPPPPTDVRSVALTAIAIVLVLYALQVAAPLILPIYVAVLATFLLAPLVTALARLRIPPALGALLVLAAVVTGGAAGIALLASPVNAWMDRAPQSMQLIEHKLRSVKEPLLQVGDVTDRVESIADVGSSTPSPVVQVAAPPLRETLVAGTLDLALALAVVLVLLYFLLVSGDALVRKLVAIQPRAEQRRRIVAIVRSIDADVSRYLLTIFCINIGLGLAVATVTHLLAMPNPLLWGVTAAVLNFVPFLGALVTGGILAIAALLTFPDPGQALLVPAAFFAITSLEGFVVTPALVGRQLHLSPIAVLVSLLLWSWLWGIPGALLAVPTLAILKIASDHHPALRHLGVLIAR